jgi:hypothetical protein
LNVILNERILPNSNIAILSLLIGIGL